MGPETARRCWELAEPAHAVAYFAPEVRAALEDVGMRGFWMGYFAARTAPLGPVSAEVATAVVFNFHPGRVAKAIPDAWTFAAPDAVLAARDGGVRTALGRLVGDGVAEPDLVRAAGTLGVVMDAADQGGRPLSAAHAALPWPDDPLLAVWHGCTRLREHRGDGHVAALVAEGIAGCEAHLMLVAEGRSTAELQQLARGWSENDWARATEAFRARGWLDERAALTDLGRDTRARIEARTDELAARPLRALADDDDRAHLFTVLESLRARVLAADAIPFPNPIGLTDPGRR